MSLIVTADRTNDYELAPAGSHVARCFRLVDLGTQTIAYKGENKQQRKLLITWELPEERMADGRPFSISKRFTHSLHEKSALHRDLESWRGRPFTPVELARFDLTTLIGKTCLLSVVHTETERGQFANLSTIMPLPRAMIVPEPINTALVFDIDNPDMEAFADLSKRLQEQIASAPEWTRATAEQGAQVRDVLADDIPF